MSAQWAAATSVPAASVAAASVAAATQKPFDLSVSD